MLVVTMDVLLYSLAVLGLVAAGWILFVPSGVGFEDLLRRTDLAWPRGVQEEEPAPWHLDRLRPHTRGHEW
jgi:hypothetical protein